ncbi:MAG: penicillin-binding protein activator [Gammaproteobacteria bacterium]|nr:penicillin-binding protein activator [Gammaproteobacteria bacterium]
MRRTLPLQQITTAVLVSALLWGCASEVTREDPGPVLPQPPAVVEEKVSLALPPSAYRGAFNRVESALADFNWMAASNLLDAVPTPLPNADDRAYHYYLQARIAYLRGEQATARALLREATAADIAPGMLYRIRNFQHFVFSLGGEHVAAARLAAGMLEWLPDAEITGWKQRTWRSLQRASAAQLEEELASAVDPQWMGWLHLAADARPDDASLGVAITRWRSQYPNHPADKPLPGGLDTLPESATGATRVGLILPLSGRLGPAGHAVLDGYLAAYFQARTAGAVTPQLAIIDQDQHASAAAAYDAAISRGAQVIVGPLSKSAVTDLAMRPDRTVPMIALNRIDSELPPGGAPVIQMSLSSEDEAITLAERAFGRGHRNAAILTLDDDWGIQVDRALRDRWQQLGGRVVSGATYAERDNYSSSVKDALGLLRSEERARVVRDMLATNVEFTPRRRQDLDVIFLLSRNPAQAKALKPLFAFHYAAQVPVYTLSNAYSGLPGQANRDLQGMHLVEIPWFLGEQPELRVAIASGGTDSDNYARLNALGADAWLVQSQFARLRTGPQALFRGSTGLLTLDPQLRIRREATLAVFDGEGIRRN